MMRVSLFVLCAAFCLAGCSGAQPSKHGPYPIGLEYRTGLDSARVADLLSQREGVEVASAPRGVFPGSDLVVQAHLSKHPDGTTVHLEHWITTRGPFLRGPLQDVANAFRDGVEEAGSRAVLVPSAGDPVCTDRRMIGGADAFVSGTDTVYTRVDTPPSMEPSLEAGMKSLSDRIYYEQGSKVKGVEGQIYVQFFVDPTGAVHCPSVDLHVPGYLEDISVAAVRESTFTPGLMDGRPVNVLFTLPITYRLRSSSAEMRSFPLGR